MGTQIVFSKDWQENVIGQLKPGTSFEVVYDSNRLPEIRDTYNGLPAWSILGYLKVISGTTENYYYKALETPGQGEIMRQTYGIPEDADEISMWFENTGRSGRVAYDSNYSQNYNFRFPSKDISVLQAIVTTSWPTPYSRLDIKIETSLQVETAKALCKITTPNNDITYQDYDFSFYEVKDNRKIYTLQTYIAYNATVSFDIAYWVSGREYIDNNEGSHYVTPISIQEGRAGKSEKTPVQI
jgi:hypothetical protein